MSKKVPLAPKESIYNMVYIVCISWAKGLLVAQGSKDTEEAVENLLCFMCNLPSGGSI